MRFVDGEMKYASEAKRVVVEMKKCKKERHTCGLGMDLGREMISPP